jgi:tetratricopeptide (TPR) repeat protein
LQPQGDLDGAHYVELARRVASGGPLALGDAFYVSPLYVFFLAGVLRAGGDLAAARLVQVLLGTAAVGLVYLTARVWYGEAAARVAGLLAVMTGIFSFYEVIVLQAALDPFLTACALYLVSRAVTERRWGVAGLAGVVTGLLTLNRPNALPFAVLVVGGLWWSAWRGESRDSSSDQGDAPAATPARPRGAWRPAAAFAAGLGLLLAGNGLRNYAASGQWVAIASHGGLNFYIGNHAGADGTYQLVSGISPSIAGQVRDAARDAEAETGRHLDAGEVSRVFSARAWRWIVAEPIAAARLFARKIALVFNRASVPLNYSYAFYARDEPTLLRWLVVGAWLLVPLGVAGLLVPGRARPGGFWVWASFVPVYGLSVATFFVSARYRMPVLVPLCAASGATLVHGFAQLRARRSRALRGPALVVVLASVVAFWPLGVDEGLGGERTRKAVWLVEQGRLDEAQRYVAAVVSTHSHPGILHFRVAEALATANHLEAAVEHYQQALAIDGPRPAIRLPLGQALVVAGRASDAVPHVGAALEAGYRREIAGPWLVRALALSGDRAHALSLLDTLPEDLAAASPTTASDLGTLALQMEAPEQALRWWRIAAGQMPPNASALESLGATLLMVGRDAEAVGPLEQACRLDASSPGAPLNLALALARLGRIGDALRAAREAQQRAPGEPRVLDLLDMLARAPRRSTGAPPG